MESFGKFVCWLASTILAMMFGGMVLLLLWQWFVSPLFPQMPALSLPAAMGIRVLAASFGRMTLKDMEEKVPFEDTMKQTMLNVFYGGMVLFIGWLVHFWMPN